MIISERRSCDERRLGNNRRSQNGFCYIGPDRRKGQDRRVDNDRRKAIVIQEQFKMRFSIK